jgi:hypothetical protein
MVYIFVPVMSLEEWMSSVSRLKSMMSLHRMCRSGLCFI